MSEQKRLVVILMSIGISLCGMFLFTRLNVPGWKAAWILNGTNTAFLLGMSAVHRDRLIPKLLLFGMAFGVVELAADAYLVDGIHVLDYSIGGGPMLWRSPTYMPLAWAIVVTQLGYLGMRLVQRFRVAGYLLIGLIGALNIPTYEELAFYTRWWRYENCRMFRHTPYHIIVGEFIIAIGATAVAMQLQRRKFTSSAALGALAGLVPLVGYALGFWITG